MSFPPPPQLPLLLVPPPKRIKRQRRKLRGKYSGDCVSCNAKWSKCWYIASVDNQPEWEARLGIPIHPTDDEVCFQCWDGKIRTSPKRKQSKIEEIDASSGSQGASSDQTLSQSDIGLSTADSTDSDRDSPRKSEESPRKLEESPRKHEESPRKLEESKSPRKFVESPRGHNKRAFVEDYGTTVQIGDNTTTKTSQTRTSQIRKTQIQIEIPAPHADNDESMFEEHEAVFLLSTAFKTFPSSPRTNNSSNATTPNALDDVNTRTTEGTMELEFEHEKSVTTSIHGGAN